MQHIRKRLRDGYSDRYIIDELERLYETKLRSFSSWNVLQYAVKNAYWAKQQSKMDCRAGDEERLHIADVVDRHLSKSVGLLLAAVVTAAVVPPLRLQWRKLRVRMQSAKMHQRAERLYSTQE